MLAESIFSRLRAVATLAGESVFPVIAPEAQAAPYIVWQEISSVPDIVHDGASTSGRRVVQFSCVGNTYKEARNLGAQVVAALDSITLAGGEICLSCNELDGFSEATDQFI